MQSRRTYLIVAALSAVLVLDGCAWTKRTWNRLWGRDSEETQQEARRQAEQQEPAIVTGSEGDIASPGQPAGTIPGDIPGMPETQAASRPQAPAVAPAGELPSATATPATPTPAPQPQAPAATDMQKQGTDMAMAEQPRGQVITLQADSTFAFGKSELTGAGKKKLDDLAARLTGMDKAAIGSIMVIGHADRIGSGQRNQVLSEQRAEAVRAYLAGHGVDEALIRTEGRGASDPVTNCPGDKVTKKLINCLAPNRRVEVTINSR